MKTLQKNGQTTVPKVIPFNALQHNYVASSRHLNLNLLLKHHYQQKQ